MPSLVHPTCTNTRGSATVHGGIISLYAYTLTDRFMLGSIQKLPIPLLSMGLDNPYLICSKEWVPLPNHPHVCVQVHVHPHRPNVDKTEYESIHTEAERLFWVYLLVT